MKDKTLYRVHVPSTEHVFELWVPDALMAGQARDLLCELIARVAPDDVAFDEDTALFELASGGELRADVFMGNFGYPDGCELLLV